MPCLRRLCRVHYDLLALHRLPLHKHGSNDRECAGSDGDVKSLRQGKVVGTQYTRQELRFNGILEFCSAHRQHDLGVEVGYHSAEVLDKLVRKDVLADTDEECASESLREHHDGGTDGHIGCGEGGLDHDERLLHTKTNTSTKEELVADPLGRARISLKGCEKAGTDGHQDTGHKHEWGVVSENSDKNTRCHGYDNQAQNSWQVHDARFGCAGSLDGLEPDS
jgi:hypothetical protein